MISAYRPNLGVIIQNHMLKIYKLDIKFTTRRLQAFALLFLAADRFRPAVCEIEQTLSFVFPLEIG